MTTSIPKLSFISTQDKPIIPNQFRIGDNGKDSIAIFSPDMEYRYVLTKKTGIPGNKILIWLMLNPSTADAFKLDPTVTRCFKRSQRMGANEMIILNLFAMRSPYPTDLYKVFDPVGQWNNYWISYVVTLKENISIVCAWGSHPKVKERAEYVLGMIPKQIPLLCLGITKEGWPVHPLHIAYEKNFESFN
jgi:hypothetical protein